MNEAYSVSLEEGLENAGFATSMKQPRALFDAHKAAHEKEFEKPEGTFKAMLVPYTPPEMILIAGPGRTDNRNR